MQGKQCIETQTLPTVGPILHSRYIVILTVLCFAVHLDHIVLYNLQEMSPRHSNIDIVPLEHYGSMMDTNIVANHCAVMSEDPYGSTSIKPLIHDNSPDRGPPKRGGPSPLGAKQLQVKAVYAYSHIVGVQCVLLV